jgi:hypothetical protein
MFNLERLEEIVKPETEEERNKRLQSEMILWHKKIRQLRNLIFPCLLLMVLISCGEGKIHNKLEIINLKGEVLNSYDNISFIHYVDDKIKFKYKDTIIVTNQFFRYESIYDNSGY